MSDIFDDATDTEARYREQALARQREKGEGPDVRNEECADCGEVIDPARREAVRNCRRCIECERRNATRLKLLKR